MEKKPSFFRREFLKRVWTSFKRVKKAEFTCFVFLGPLSEEENFEKDEVSLNDGIGGADGR